jgi:excisionase family DNA binding protein
MTAASPDVAALLAQVVQLLASQPSVAVPEPRPETSPNRVLLTVEEAAERLGIGRTTAWGLVKSGALHSVQIGRLRRVPASALDTYATQLPTGRESASNSEER